MSPDLSMIVSNPGPGVEPYASLGMGVSVPFDVDKFSWYTGINLGVEATL